SPRAAIGGGRPSIVCNPEPAGSTSASTTLRPSWARYTPRLTARRLFPTPPRPPPTLMTRGVGPRGGRLSGGGSGSEVMIPDGPYSRVARGQEVLSHGSART